MRDKFKYKLKAVVDTNIFIDGLFSSDESKKYCVKIIEMIDNKKIQLLFAQDTIGELVYVIKNFTRHNIDDIKERISILQYLMELFYYSTSINTKDAICPEINDKYDYMFLKTAITGNAEYLISDDLKSGMHNVKNLGFKILNAKDFCMLFE